MRPHWRRLLPEGYSLFWDGIFPGAACAAGRFWQPFVILTVAQVIVTILLWDGIINAERLDHLVMLTA